jgi:hypothetical protein
VTLLPFQVGDVVRWRGQLGVVVEVRGERLCLRTEDDVLRITTQERLREQQRRKGRVA